MRSYDYEKRDGVDRVDWERFSRVCEGIAADLSERGVDVVVGVARAGLVPAVVVAAELRCDLIPVRVTRRENDVVVREQPVWKTDIADDVAGRNVAVVDDVADTGETLAMVAARAHEAGAASVVTAALVAHTWADPSPDVAGLRSDALVVLPWDERVLVDGEWRIHPELRPFLDEQE